MNKNFFITNMPIIKTIFQLNAEFMRAETQLKAAQQQPIRVVKCIFAVKLCGDG